MRPERGGGELMAGGGSGPSPWRTPTPYLFLGFALMMGLIIVALFVLICTRSRSRRQEAGAEKAASSRGVLVPLDREAPRVVVIMAGDLAPSFLASARPLAFAGATAARAAAVAPDDGGAAAA
ncbi:unnamed protein product [Urochloa humidicola]